MLYLSRKIGEAIVINNDTIIQVASISGKTAKLGFQFPQGVSVLRKEIYDKILKENISASTTINTKNDKIKLDSYNFSQKNK